jgi:hypothetical protein
MVTSPQTPSRPIVSLAADWDHLDSSLELLFNKRILSTAKQFVTANDDNTSYVVPMPPPSTKSLLAID